MQTFLQHRLLCAAAVAALSGCAALQPMPEVHQLGVTGAGQALARVTSDPVNEYLPAISPDESTLLFDAVVRDGYKSESVVVGVDPDTGARRTHFTSSSTLALESAWLPDGSSFIYTSNALGKWALVRSLSKSPNAAVTVIIGGDAAPSVSRPSIAPDGKRVAFAVMMRNTWTIGVSHMDGSQFTILGEGMQPAWSPDGKKVAFVRTVGGFNHVFYVDPDTGTNLVQVTNGEYNDEFPAWAPDSSLIVFGSSRGSQELGGGARGRNLFAIRSDGNQLTQLTNGDGIASAPCWGKHGWIYFSSNQAGNFDIWRFKVSGELAAR